MKVSEPEPVDPGRLGRIIESVLDQALVGFDVDGVLAPITAHADEAAVDPAVHRSIDRLSARTAVVIVSGRSLADLEERFAFPAGVRVIGSHGLESRGDDDVVLDGDEQRTFDRLESLGLSAVEAAGDGAWLEHKPASVVVHTRLADPELAGQALETVVRLAETIDGAQVKEGHHVIELFARAASKGESFVALARRLGRPTLVFFGDDVTDEDAFALMGGDDISVRVGPGRTAARYRLSGPDDVAELLEQLT